MQGLGTDLDGSEDDSMPQHGLVDRTLVKGPSLAKQRTTAINHFARFATKMGYSHHQPEHDSFYEPGVNLALMLCYFADFIYGPDSPKIQSYGAWDRMVGNIKMILVEGLNRLEEPSAQRRANLVVSKLTDLRAKFKTLYQQPQIPGGRPRQLVKGHECGTYSDVVVYTSYVAWIKGMWLEHIGLTLDIHIIGRVSEVTLYSYLTGGHSYTDTPSQRFYWGLHK